MPTVLQSWKESLSFFLPQNAKQFFLVSLKTIVQSYRILFRDFWWLIGLIFAVEYIRHFYFFNSLVIQILLPLFMWLFLIFVMYLIIRPSIKRKSYAYYKEYSSIFFYFVLFSICSYQLLNWVIEITLKALSATIGLNLLSVKAFLIALTIPFIDVPMFIWPLFSFFILFFLDSQKRLSSIGSVLLKAGKMVVYNYPFCVILLCAWVLLYSIPSYFSSITLFAVFQNIISQLLLPIPFAVWTNFYTKRLHDQFLLYYPHIPREQ